MRVFYGRASVFAFGVAPVVAQPCVETFIVRLAERVPPSRITPVKNRLIGKIQIPWNLKRNEFGNFFAPRRKPVASTESFQKFINSVKDSAASAACNQESIAVNRQPERIRTPLERCVNTQHNRLFPLGCGNSRQNRQFNPGHTPHERLQFLGGVFFRFRRIRHYSYRT